MLHLDNLATCHDYSILPVKRAAAVKVLAVEQEVVGREFEFHVGLVDAKKRPASQGRRARGQRSSLRMPSGVLKSMRSSASA